MDAVICYSVPKPLPETELLVRAALQAQGFGILTEVDLTATLRQKLDVDIYPYRLLGACNPALAHNAISTDPRVGAFLPCGISLYEATPGTTTVCLQNPQLIADLVDTPGLDAPANEASERLRRALDSVGSAIQGGAQPGT